MFNLDEMNLVLNQLGDDSILEMMVEPIDDPNLEINFWDWAEAVGIVEEFVPYEYQTS
jgi:hypothetical protein